MKSYLEEILQADIQESGIPVPVREHCFCDRKWRFDFAWPEIKLAVEVEGGTRMSGRHNRADGYEEDCEKYNHAVFVGWRVLRFTGDMVKNRTAIGVLKKFFTPSL